LIVNSLQKNMLEEKLAKNAVIAELMSNKIDIYLELAMNDVAVTAQQISNGDKSEEAIYKEINRLNDYYGNFDLVFFMNTEGRMVYSNPYNPIAIEEMTYTDRDYYNHIMTYEEPYISHLYISRVLGKPHFVLAAPIYHEGNLYGLVAAGIPLREMKKVIMSADTTFNGGIWVMDSYGSLIVHPYSELSDEEVTVFEDVPVLLNEKETNLYAVMGDQIKGTVVSKREEARYYMAVTTVEGADLVVMVEQEMNVLYSEAYEVLNDLIFVAIIVLVVGLIVGLVLSVGITKPIQRLVYLVRMWTAGDNRFDEITVNQQGEIGELETAFKDLATKLDSKVGELKNSVARENKTQQYLNNILMSVGSGIIVTDSDNKIVIFNKAAELLVGLSGKEVLGKDYSNLKDKINYDLKEIIEELNNDKHDMAEKEVLIYTIEKRNIPCRIVCSKVKDNQDQGIGYVFLMINLELIKKMEEELKREDRLSIVGEFSSSIIHDIGNPLAGLSNLLELYKSELTSDEEKDEIMKLIEEEISELNHIVLEFLHFTKSKAEKDLQVDVCQVVSEAINIMRGEMINRDIRVRQVFDETTLYANIDRRNFKQAIINIVKNAIQAIGNNGWIDVFIRDKEETIDIVIRDTGIGIKEEAIQNIFEPFYTTKRDGTGLGLSTAYKTIRENEGKLEVTSKHKEGSEFRITIPKRRGD